jgi:hypothetical protein
VESNSAMGWIMKIDIEELGENTNERDQIDWGT